MMNTLIALTLASVLKPSTQSFCKFLYQDYFNIETINYVPTPFKLNDSSQLYPTLCDDVSGPDQCTIEGNMYYLTSKGRCETLATADKSNLYSWKRYKVKGIRIWEDDNATQTDIIKNSDKVPSEERLFREDKLDFNTTMIITMDTSEPDLNDLGVKSISYVMVCPQEYKIAQSRYKMRLTNGTVLFLYKGNKACGYNIIEATVFLKRHKNFMLVIGIVAMVILVGSRFKYKKLSLGLGGFEIGVLTSVIFMAGFEHQKHLEGVSLSIFYTCCLSVGVLIGLFCAYSLESAVFLQAFNAAMASTFTLSCIYSLTFERGVSQPAFWVINIIFSFLLVAITASPRFIYKYAYKFYINFNQPFYVIYCLCVYFDVYPETISMSVAKEYGITIHPYSYTWLLVFVQVFGTVVLEMDAFGAFEKLDLIELGVDQRDMISFMYCLDEEEEKDKEEGIDDDTGNYRKGGEGFGNRNSRQLKKNQVG